jgi:hypothetical protein
LLLLLLLLLPQRWHPVPPCPYTTSPSNTAGSPLSGASWWVLIIILGAMYVSIVQCHPPAMSRCSTH